MSKHISQQGLQRLIDIMATLRSLWGCPWDAKQPPESLKPYLLEETYEVIEAIDTNTPDALREELGDLLLQTASHSRIQEEHNRFTFDDVTNHIADKKQTRLKIPTEQSFPSAKLSQPNFLHSFHNPMPFPQNLLTSC